MLVRRKESSVCAIKQLLGGGGALNQNCSQPRVALNRGQHRQKPSSQDAGTTVQLPSFCLSIQVGKGRCSKTLRGANAHSIISLRENEWLEYWRGEFGSKILWHKDVYVWGFLLHTSNAASTLIRFYLESLRPMQITKTKASESQRWAKPILDDFGLLKGQSLRSSLAPQCISLPHAGKRGARNGLTLVQAGCTEVVNGKTQKERLPGASQTATGGNSPGDGKEEGEQMNANHKVQKSCYKATSTTSLIYILCLAVWNVSYLCSTITVAEILPVELCITFFFFDGYEMPPTTVFTPALSW